MISELKNVTGGCSMQNRLSVTSFAVLLLLPSVSAGDVALTDRVPRSLRAINIPPAFEPNVGQFEEDTRFAFRSNHYSFSIGKSTAWFRRQDGNFRMQFAKANQA